MKKKVKLKVPAGENHVTALPAECQNANVLVEINGGGLTKAEAACANELDVQVSEGFGRLQVMHAGDRKPLSKIFLKVFAEVSDAGWGTRAPRFYKDGYTGLRGKIRQRQSQHQRPRRHQPLQRPHQERPARRDGEPGAAAEALSPTHPRTRQHSVSPGGVLVRFEVLQIAAPNRILRPMSAICLDLEQTLSRLDPRAAADLERLVQDALVLARGRSAAAPAAADTRGWPAGYFEQTAGSFANEPLEAPADPPAQPLPQS